MSEPAKHGEAPISLPVFSTVGRAYAALWRYKAFLLRFAVVPGTLVFAAMLTFDRLYLAHPSLAWEIESLGGLVVGLFSVPLVVQSYRLFLCGPGDDSCNSWYWMGTGCMGIAILTMVLWIAGEAQALAVGGDVFVHLIKRMRGEAGPEWYRTIAISLASAALYFFVFVRMVYLFPTLSLAKDWTLAAQWRKTRGYFWRLLIVLILANAPVLLVAVGLELGTLAAATQTGFVVAAEVTPGQGIGALRMPETVAGAAVSTLNWVATSIVSAAVVSVAYASTTRFSAQGLGPA